MIRRHRSARLSRRDILLAMLGLTTAGGTWWWLQSPSTAGPVTTDRFGDRNQTVPRGQLPDFVRSADATVQEAYRYATEQGEALEHIPCFCGCRGIGHRHNRDCYIKSFNRDGTVTYTSHSAT
jgi:hypothetical protein